MRMDPINPGETVLQLCVCREKRKYENGPYKPWGDWLKNVAEVSPTPSCQSNGKIWRLVSFLVPEAEQRNVIFTRSGSMLFSSGAISVADHIDNDPDLGSEKSVTDPVPDRTLIRIRIQTKTKPYGIGSRQTGFCTRKIFKFDFF